MKMIFVWLKFGKHFQCLCQSPSRKSYSSRTTIRKKFIVTSFGSLFNKIIKAFVTDKFWLHWDGIDFTGFVFPFSVTIYLSSSILAEPVSFLTQMLFLYKTIKMSLNKLPRSLVAIAILLTFTWCYTIRILFKELF